MTILAPIEHIEIFDNGTLGQTPRIVGTGIKVKFIVELFVYNQWTIEQIAETYELSLAQIYAALSYYYDHKTEIDRIIQRGQELIEQTFGTIGSFLDQHQIKADHTLLGADNAAMLGFSESNPQFTTISDLLNSLSGVVIERDSVLEMDEDGVKIKKRMIKFRLVQG